MICFEYVDAIKDRLHMKPIGLETWNMSDLQSLSRWLDDGVTFSKPSGTAQWNARDILASLIALNRVDFAIGNHSKVKAILGLQGGVLTFNTHINAEYTSDNVGYATSSGQITDLYFTNAPDVTRYVALERHIQGIVHELGHTLDHNAVQFANPGNINVEDKWTTSIDPYTHFNPWLGAGGWFICGAAWVMTEEGVRGAVSRYAVGGVSLVTDPNHLDYTDASPAEDFAETFKWYVMSKSGIPVIPSGGVTKGINPDNPDGTPNDERIQVLADLLARF